jgi:hypothetical protein
MRMNARLMFSASPKPTASCFGIFDRLIFVGVPVANLPAWQSIENRTMIVCNERSLQAHWLHGCGSDPVAGSCVYRKPYSDFSCNRIG